MIHLHLNLYKQWTFAIGSLAFGFNFLFLTPAFMPFSLPKEFVGPIFLACGFIKLAMLLLNAPNNQLRLSMATTVYIYSFWAAVLTFEFFRLSQTSLQLPIAFIVLAILGLQVLDDMPVATPPTLTDEVDSE